MSARYIVMTADGLILAPFHDAQEAFSYRAGWNCEHAHDGVNPAEVYEWVDEQMRASREVLMSSQPNRDADARAGLQVPARCVCLHAKQRHEIAGFEGECVADGCKCAEYRPRETVTASPRIGSTMRETPRPVPAPTPAQLAPVPSPVSAAVTEIFDAVDQEPEAAAPATSVDALLATARESELKPIAKLAERIELLVEDLRERVADEAAAESVKAHIAKLERQVAAAKAKLKTVAVGRRKPHVTVPDGEHPCTEDGCDRTFTTAQGVAMHRTRAHSANAAAS